jgi:hypothetical protein
MVIICGPSRAGVAFGDSTPYIADRRHWEEEGTLSQKQSRGMVGNESAFDQLYGGHEGRRDARTREELIADGVDPSDILDDHAAIEILISKRRKEDDCSVLLRS